MSDSVPPSAMCEEDGWLSCRTTDGDEISYCPSRPLGPRGQYGGVYEARDHAGNPIAVKYVDLTRPFGGEATEEDFRQAEREHRVGALIKPSEESHLLPVTAMSRVDNGLLFVMARAEESLQEVLARGALDPQTARAILKDLARALMELTKQSIVHRDIKPGNILRIGNRWLLSDFGVSRDLNSVTATLTWAGTGTVEYRAPELWQLGAKESLASDLYALGCVAYEMLVGRKYITGTDSVAIEHERAIPVFPRETPAPLKALIADLLAKSPASRPDDPRQVLERLDIPWKLTAAQRGLQELRATSEINRLDHERQLSAWNRRQRMKSEAFVVFDHTWDSFRALVHQADPQAEFGGGGKGGGWVTVGKNRLQIFLAEWDRDTSLLCHGTIRVEAESHARARVPANVICVDEDGRPVWKMIGFEYSGLQQPRLQSGPSAREVAGLELGNFEDAWALVNPNSESPVLSSETARLTPEAILKVFVHEASNDAVIGPGL